MTIRPVARAKRMEGLGLSRWVAITEPDLDFECKSWERVVDLYDAAALTAAWNEALEAAALKVIADSGWAVDEQAYGIAAEIRELKK